MSALIAFLRDDFEDNAVAAAWSAVASGSATVAETSGQARFTLPSSTAGTHVARYTSVVTYDLTGGSFFINIGTMVATGVAATAFFQVYIDGSNALQWIQLSGTVYARKIVAGVSTDLFSAAWSSSTYKYLRISESGGTITWSSSTNGTSWTSRATLANPFAVTDLYVDFGATCGNIASPGSFRLDDVNLILPALTTNWRWTQIVWPLANRYKVVTLALDTVGTAQGYIVTADGIDVNSDPSGNVRYWAGTAHAGRQLTEQASDVAAKAMAVNIPVDGRFDLPTIIEARVIRVYHRSIDGSAYTLREVYPRRLVQADDIEAESIRAIHIGVIDLDAQHRITAANGEIELNDVGISITTPQDTPADQDSYKFIKVDNTVLGGIYGYYSVGSASHYIIAKSVSVAGDDSHFEVYAIAPSGHVGEIFLNAQRSGSSDTSIDILNTTTRQIILDSAYAYVYGGLNVGVPASPTSTAGDIAMTGGLNAGTATGAAAGQVLATISDAGTTNVVNSVTLTHNSSGTPAAGFGLDFAVNLNSSTTDDQNAFLMRTVWATATHASRKAQTRFFAYDTAARRVIDLEASGSAAMIGFLGAAAVVRQNVTGTLTGATLAQLTTVVSNILTALTNLGATTNSTT